LPIATDISATSAAETAVAVDQTGVDRDDVLARLEELVAALEQNARRFRDIEVRAAALERGRRDGLAYRDIVPSEERPLIVQLLTESIESLHAVGSSFRRAEAKALHNEGATMEQIAEMFGVTRQRVSSLLREAALDTRGGAQ
jgi:hypothetical protein